MFHKIPERIEKRMRQLEEMDSRDREDGTPRFQRLRQISAETGKFLAVLAAAAPAGPAVEIGTSAGYSAMWLALACRASGKMLTTYEVLPEKAAMAEETFRLTAVTDVVTFIQADAREQLTRFKEISFCFLDAEKEIYEECYELVVPRMVPGGLLAADNAISHRDGLRRMLDHALTDSRLDALIVPIGKGVLLGRKCAPARN